MTRLRIFQFLLAAALLAFIAASGAVGSAPHEEQRASAAPPPSMQTGGAGVAGMQVAVDPATGRLRPPTEEERRALGAALGRLANRSADGLVAVARPGGAMSIDLRRRFLNLSVATTDPSSGTARSTCLTDAQSAAAVVNAPSNVAVSLPSSSSGLEEK